MTPTAQTPTMQAMSFSNYGGPEVLTKNTHPLPKVGPGVVLIKVKAASVNPVDWKIMAGYLDSIMDIHFPVITGWDVAGVVEAVGPDTPEFAVGDEVYSYGRRDSVQGGTFAEYVALPSAIVSHKPGELSWEQAAGLPLTGLTAQRTLDALELVAGQTLLIHNGSGGVGRIAIQLAKHAGVQVIATASAKNHQRLRDLGAEPVEYGKGLTERIHQLAPEGVDAVADFIGGVLETTLEVLKPGGKHASVADGTVAEHGGRYIWVRPDSRELDRLSKLVNEGVIGVDIAQSFPMEEAGAAFRASMQGSSGGKIVLSEFSA